MKFGGRHLPLSLRIGRMLVYIQAFVLVYLAVMAVVISTVLGSGSGLTLHGRLITGGSAISLAVFHGAVAVVLILLAMEASRGGETVRYLLIAAEIALAVYYIAFLSTDASAWVIGPGLCLAVIVCHSWDWITGQAPVTAAAAATATEPAITWTPPAPAAEEKVADAEADHADAAAEAAAPAAKKPAAPRRRAPARAKAETASPAPAKRKRAPRSAAAKAEPTAPGDGTAGEAADTAG